MANLVEIIAVAGQRVFDLPFTYTVGSNELFVFWNGQLQYNTIQYNETNPTRVTLTFDAEAGDDFTFRVPSGAFSGFVAPTTFAFAPRLPRPERPLVLAFSP
jgi:hypothetical protein